VKNQTLARSWILLVAIALVISAIPAMAQYSGQRVPLGILVTNWDCGPCAPANQTLDDYYPDQGNEVALIRVHCWWPGPDDPIYEANVSQSTFLVNNTPSGPDYAPHLWVDNYVNGGSTASAMVGFIEDRKSVPSPLVIDIDWNIDTEVVTAHVDILDAMPAADYRIYVAITEDEIFASGSNGEDYHNQAFRRLYPDTDGLVVANELGVQVFEIDSPLHSRWVYENVRTTVYVQNMDTGEVQNTATMLVSENVVAVSDDGDETSPDDLAAAVLQVSAYPNPFNPLTNVRYVLPEAGAVTVRVHDLTGKVVATLVQGGMDAGVHETVWQGRDDRGQQVASGVYLVQIRSGLHMSSQKLVLSK